MLHKTAIFNRMKKRGLFFAFWVPFLMQAQFVFKGQVSKPYANSQVYLSFVDDYRKTSRIYLDQIISKSSTDSLANFSFTGNHLPENNGIYRIHVDKCSDNGTTNHFLRECPESLSLLFIANNHDTLTFPLTRQNQPFCSIVSTNITSEHLLEVEALKEEMIFDFLDGESTASKDLHFKKWFSTMQAFASETKEPLVEVYVYDFLSDRSNETHDFYLNDLPSNTYYQELLNRLQQQYPQQGFTKQYQNELRADLSLMEAPEEEQDKSKSFLFYALAAVILLSLAFLFLKKWLWPKRKGTFDMLTAQERKIAAAILEDKSNKEIANELFISLSTVKTHINSIYKKLNVTSRTEIKTNFRA